MVFLASFSTYLFISSVVSARTTVRVPRNLFGFPRCHAVYSSGGRCCEYVPVYGRTYDDCRFHFDFYFVADVSYDLLEL